MKNNIFMVSIFVVITATLLAGVFIPGAAVKLAEIESMDGLAFTVGGLVIAAVAIFTQINLREQIDRVIDDRLNTFSQKQEENMGKVVESYLVFTQALQNIGLNWRRAESLARNALQTNPGLNKHVAPAMGIGYAEYSSRILIAKHCGVYPPLNELRQQVAFLSVSDLPIHEAISWLESAKNANQQSVPNTRLRLGLACMYALFDRFDNMCDELREILSQQDEIVRELAIDSFSLMSYAFSCRHDTENRLALLSRILKTKLPVSQPDVCERTVDQLSRVASFYDDEQRQAVGRSRTQIIASYWCVMPHEMSCYSKDLNSFPTILHIFRTSNNIEDRVNAELERDTSLLRLREPVSPQQAVRELCERYYFVSQIPHPIEATRDANQWLSMNSSIPFA